MRQPDQPKKQLNEIPRAAREEERQAIQPPLHGITQKDHLKQENKGKQS